MKLSIIVPVYNMAGDGKLQYCLDSLVNQTIGDYEIIAVDDASTDDSYEILKAYQEKYSDKFVALSLKENHKQGGAKNKALDIARGEYIGFVDADDWISSDMYEKLINESERTGADVVACDLVITDSHSMEMKTVQSGIPDDIVGEINHEIFEKMINNSGYMVVKVYKRSIFEEPKLRFPEHMFYEDNAIGLEVSHRIKKLAHVKEPMYFYYQHQGSTVHVVSEERCEMRKEAMRIMLKYAKDNGYFEEYKKEIEYKFINLFYQNTLFSYMSGTQKKKISFIYELGKEMRETFPNFQTNSIYLEKANSEERKLMAMQQKNTLLFIVYYKLLWAYRKLRYGKK